MPEPENADVEPKNDTPGTSKAAEAEESAEGGGIPAGVIPLFLTGAGQQIFECVVDKDVTPETANKLISKEKIIEDFKNRAAVSDFHPVKKQMQGYEGDEILLVYDYDFKYGENFYVCVTEEAKDLILNPPETELGEGGKAEEEEEEDQIPTTPVPVKWECLGSDLEIKEGQFQEKKSSLQYTVIRKRRYFEQPYIFSSRTASSNADFCLDIASQEKPEEELFRIEMEKGTQAVPEMDGSSCQTDWLEPCNKAVQYSPRQLTESEAEDTMNEPSMEGFLHNAMPRIEVCLQQNCLMNMFEDDYKLLSVMDGITGKKSDATLKEYQSFTDLRFSKNKVITHIEWHPTIKGIIAVSCGESLTFDDQVDLSNLLLRKQSLVLIWSFTDPIHPILFLEAPDNVLCFKFNPTDPNVIVGGCANGQLVLWDIEEHQDRLQINKAIDALESRATAANKAVFDTDPKLDHAPMVQYCVTTSIKEGHSREVGDVQWLPHTIEICHKTGGIVENKLHQCCQLISCSIDGSVLVWDMRLSPTAKPPANYSQEQKSRFSYLDLTWKPLIKVPLPRSELPGKYASRRVSISERHTPLPKDHEEMPYQLVISDQGPPIEGASTMFFVGTEDGEVVYSDWKPRKDSETGKLTVPLPSYHFNCHAGPICCVERSPFFKDIVLTVGGCTWMLWKEGDQSGCLLSSSSSSVPLSGGAWSPTRPGVFFIIKTNGNIDVWDVMDRSHEGLLTQNISSVALTSVYPWQLTSKQLMVAVGDSGGTLHILEIPWNLSHPSNNELNVMENFFQRQVERLQFTTDRMQKREREKKEIDALKVEEQKGEEVSRVSENWEEKAKKDYDGYLDLELKLLMELGLKERPNPED